jgi:hypothetical protein
LQEHFQDNLLGRPETPYVDAKFACQKMLGLASLLPLEKNCSFLGGRRGPIEPSIRMGWLS